MKERFSRTASLIGEAGVEALAGSRVLIVGVGGVGGYTTEALARAGVGTLGLVDSDRISESNINRQIIADYTTVGEYKTEAFRDRISKINPDCRVICHSLFLNEDNIDSIDLGAYDYVVDACDTVSTKVALCIECDKKGVRLISSMGAGNKMDPTAFMVSDIYKTSVCPLARAMRVRLKKLGIKKLKVVYSKEEPFVTTPPEQTEPKDGTAEKRRPPASISFVPSAAGLIIASEVVKDLISEAK